MDPNHRSEPSEHLSDFLIVGLGGSAGAIPAFKEFFAAVPDSSGIAYVVVLHMSPDHESRLAEVIQQSTRMPVIQLRDPVRLQPDHVYVAPPGAHLGVRDEVVTCSESSTTAHRRAPIDIFFRALADTHGQRVGAAIMSGSGSDGSVGIKRIKERNGVVFAQDPEEAEFAEMPRNSIAAGVVDEVLTAGEMPKRFVTYRDQIRQTSPHKMAEDGREEALTEIFSLLRVRTGHDFTNYKRATVTRRIARRMGVRQVRDLASYAAYVRQHADEAHLLLQDLLISVTNFFRDSAAFETLEQTVIPALFSGKASADQVRIWVPACATGEEAYSIAILLVEHAATRGARNPIQIFATDLDQASITKARAGCYTATELVDVSPERLRQWFLPDGDGYRIRREIRELVLFASHNLLKDPPFSHLDLVSCRNLLIYLNRAAQQRALETMHFALNQGGYLFLGAAETPEIRSNLFTMAHKEAHIYQSQGPRASRSVFPSSSPPSGPLEIASPSPIPTPPGRTGIVSFGELHQRLLEEYAPPSLIVNDSYDILHLSDGAASFVSFAGGEPSLNLLRAAHPDLRSDLRSALYGASQSHAPVRIPDVRVAREDRVQMIDIIVRPVLREDIGLRGVYLVFFEETGAMDRVGGEETRTIQASSGTPALEEEIVRLRDQLRTNHEQHETHTEELKAANEELQAMNEELRSATEELETSREELQSVNEELHTVNQELKAKIDELSQANDDMRNLMSSTEIGTVFLDRGLRLKLFTPRAADIFNFIPSDTGRPLHDVTNKLVSEELLTPMIEKVLERLHPLEREVETRDGRHHLMRILPYRTSDDRIDGAVLTFLDISALKRTQGELRDSHHRAVEHVASRDRAEAALESKSELLRQIVAAQEEERLRLARELHDEMGQHLTALKIGIESLSEPHGAQQLRELRRMVTQIDESLDRVASQLRPAALTDVGLTAALGQLVDHFRATTRTNIDFHVQGMDHERLAENIEVTLYRATQEALTNVARHANSTSVSVVLERRRNQVQLIVEDDGQGFDPEVMIREARPSGRLGIIGMKERTELAGGTFELESEPGSGTTLYLRIPLPESESGS